MLYETSTSHQKFILFAKVNIIYKTKNCNKFKSYFGEIMLIKIFVRTFASTEDCELFESILETRWPNLLQQVKGVRFRAMKNPQTPNVSVVLWEFPDADSMRKIDKLIDENIAKYVKTLSPKTIHFVGGVTQDFGETTF